MKLSYELEVLLEEIKDKENELEDMAHIWENNEGDEIAASDPSDQFCLSEEIDELWANFKKIVNEKIK